APAPAGAAPVARDPVVNAAVADAKSLPELVTKLNTVDPALAQSIEGKALVASRTPWGVVIGFGVAWAASKYGLGWDADLCALVSGVAVLAAGYVMRLVTAGPIRGWF